MKKETDKPTLIMCKTVLVLVHQTKRNLLFGAPLVMLKLQQLVALGWSYGPFEILKISMKLGMLVLQGKRKTSAWDKFAAYAAQFPELAAEFTRRMNGELPLTLTRMRSNLLKICNKTQQISRAVSITKCIRSIW